ncbi:uncharacterized protein LOC100200634 [Hydra vulgaris]|uniref:Protein aurora borealis n=1 Tax=Hydra vulgaris TaxID=6087 RepID=A0ABM4C5U6_HYDVU
MQSHVTEESMTINESAIDDTRLLELTRNPFDSNLYERDNFPTLDSSVFQISATPKHDSNGEFRWSIDQIALLKPAEMDLNPNQEYSVVYSTQEDEEQSQRQVDEYFKSALLPSPWLDNRASALKRVTFSPDFPSAHYINGVVNQKINKPNASEEVQLEETLLSDACCQTELTFSMDFDLQILVGKKYYSYSDESGEARALMISSLRRKLFVQEIKTPLKSTSKVCSPYATPSYTTSSPTKQPLDISCAHKNTSITASESSTPSINSFSSASLHNVFESPAKVTPPQIVAVCTPLRHCGDITLSNVSMSPIRSSEKLSSDISDFSYLPDVSLEFNVNGSEIRESSRAVQFKYQDISPIKKEMAVDPATDTLSMQESCQSEFQVSSQQSIKESTAKNMHAFGGFDISSISDYSAKLLHQKEAQQGSIDVTDITSSNIFSIDETTDMNISKCSDDDEPEVLHITDLSLDEKQITDDLSHLLPNFSVIQGNSGEYVSPKIVTFDNHESMTTPLKGILKHRDITTPKRTNLRDFDSLDSTQYNTVYNSGSRRKAAANFLRTSSSILLSSINDKTTLPKPKLSDFSESQSGPDTPVRGYEHRYNENKVSISSVNRQCLRDITIDNIDRSAQNKYFKDYITPMDFPLNHDIVCLRANTALKRAYEVSNSLHIEDKENYCAMNFQNNIRLSSTILSSDSPELRSERPVIRSTGKNYACIDGYYANLSSKHMPVEKENKVESSAISPCLSLDTLSISSNSKNHSPATKKTMRASSQRRISGLTRNYSWPYKSRATSPFFSDDSNIIQQSGNTPQSSRISGNRSRVLPKYRGRSPSFRGEELFDPMKSAYKDFLPSPLK